jgi:hypothetical protein
MSGVQTDKKIVPVQEMLLSRKGPGTLGQH